MNSFAPVALILVTLDGFFRTKICKVNWVTLWNILFLIFHVFFLFNPLWPWLLQLSECKKTQWNGGLSKISVILVKWIFFCKCCHFFDFYPSVSCKNQDDRELNRTKHGISRTIYFIDFNILFCFADFFPENPSNVTPNPCKLWKKGLASDYIFLIFQFD